MKNANFLTLSICVIIILAMAFAVTGFFSYRAYSSSSGLEKVYLQAIRTLKELIGSQNTKIASLNKKIAVLEDRLTANSVFSNIGSKNEISRNNNGNLITMSSEDLKRLKQIIESTEREQLRLARIIESTGLEQLSKIENIDPDILREIYDDRTKRNRIASHRSYLREQNRELHLADKRRYDEELNSLYRRARFRRRRGANNEDSNKAFNEMLAKYPDAYATAMVIAERALFYARRNTADTEKYYIMLRENENESYSNIITDRGIEAKPNIEYYLANQYVREGRLEDANSMLDSLEKNYSDSLLRMRKGAPGPRWQPVSQGVARLRFRMR
jgi:hypothetical protein